MAKFLLCGNDSELINNLFYSGVEDAKFLSTTENPEDVKTHAELFKPDGFIYCVKAQTEDQIKSLKESCEFLGDAQKNFVIAGNDSEIDAVYSQFSEKAPATIPREIGLNAIHKKISDIAKSIDDAQKDNFDPDVIEKAEHIPVDNFDPNVVSSAGKNSTDGFDPSIIDTILGGGQMGNATHTQVINKKKIMIVDDDPNILRAIRNFLQDKYIISVASSGRVALKFLEEKVVDLIFLDYMMPDMDGPTVLSYIRNSVLTHKIPVVFLTGVSDREKIKQILGMNIQGYMLKPVESQKLLECVHRILHDDEEE